MRPSAFEMHRTASPGHNYLNSVRREGVARIPLYWLVRPLINATLAIDSAGTATRDGEDSDSNFRLQGLPVADVRGT